MKPKPKPKAKAPAKRRGLGAYPRPSVTVDVVLLAAVPARSALHALVVRRSEPPFGGRWALPGGFVGIDEPLDAAARRVVREKARLADVFMEQLYTFGSPRRDPRGRVITVAYYALVDEARFRQAAAEAKGEVAVARLDVGWEGETGGPVDVVSEHESGAALPLLLAFDHGEIVGMAVKRLRGKLDYTPVGFQLLPPSFTLRQLQDVHETVLGRPLNKDSFRRRILASGLLDATGERQDDVDHRPAELYRFGRQSAT